MWFIISACLISHPESCDKFKVQVFETFEQCQSNAVVELVNWYQRTGQQWRVTEFHCEK